MSIEAAGRMRLVYDDDRRGEWAEAVFELDAEDFTLRTPAGWLEGPVGTAVEVECEVGGTTLRIPIRDAPGITVTRARGETP